MATAAAAAPERIFFGPFDVSTQVFHTTPLSFALVNLKPLLPGHVLVCPRRPHQRLTDLQPDELTDLFGAVQRVQRMLATHYFPDSSSSGNLLRAGSFNLAIQDGPEAGQTVPHVHVHVIPRIRGATAKDAATDGDALYEQMAAEPGNVGGAQWDVAVGDAPQSSAAAPSAGSLPSVAAAESAESRSLGPRPIPGGQFPRIEDANRQPRSMAEMEAEAAVFRDLLAKLDQQ